MGDNVSVLLQWGPWRNIPVLEQTAVHRGRRRKMRGSARNRKTAMRTHSRLAAEPVGTIRGGTWVYTIKNKSSVISLQIGTIDKNKSRSRCAWWDRTGGGSVGILDPGRWFASLPVYRRRFGPRWDWFGSAAACSRVSLPLPLFLKDI